MGKEVSEREVVPGWLVRALHTISVYSFHVQSQDSHPLLGKEEKEEEVLHLKPFLMGLLPLRVTFQGGYGDGISFCKWMTSHEVLGTCSGFPIIPMRKSQCGSKHTSCSYEAVACGCPQCMSL